MDWLSNGFFLQKLVGVGGGQRASPSACLWRSGRAALRWFPQAKEGTGWPLPRHVFHGCSGVMVFLTQSQRLKWMTSTQALSHQSTLGESWGPTVRDTRQFLYLRAMIDSPKSLPLNILPDKKGFYLFFKLLQGRRNTLNLILTQFFFFFFCPLGNKYQPETVSLALLLAVLSGST